MKQNLFKILKYLTMERRTFILKAVTVSQHRFQKNIFFSKIGKSPTFLKHQSMKFETVHKVHVNGFTSFDTTLTTGDHHFQFSKDSVFRNTRRRDIFFCHYGFLTFMTEDFKEYSKVFQSSQLTPFEYLLSPYSPLRLLL